MTAPDARQRLREALELLDGLRRVTDGRDKDLWARTWERAFQDAEAAAAQYLAEVTE